MGIETQVTCKELSEELRDNGYIQKGYFMWVKNREYEIELFDKTMISDYSTRRTIEICVAPTVAELGEALAEYEDEDWYSEPFAGIWYCRLHTHGVKDSCTRRIEADTEANCRAKLWLYLKKIGLIK